MAKNLDDADAPGEGHNSGKSRDEILKECADTIRRVKEARAELNEDMKEMRERVKELGMIPRHFELGVRMADLEDEARNSQIDALRETFKALGVGAQADFGFDQQAAQ